IPIDVEEIGVRRRLPVLQYIVPPRVRGRVESHVVGHKIEDQAHAPVAESGGESVEILVGSQFLIERVMVADVVPVLASRGGLEQRRDVAVCDAKRLQIRDNTFGIAEAEVGTEL